LFTLRQENKQPFAILVGLVCWCVAQALCMFMQWKVSCQWSHTYISWFIITDFKISSFMGV